MSQTAIIINSIITDSIHKPYLAVESVIKIKILVCKGSSGSKILIMFKDFDNALPLPTRILIFITDSTAKYGLWMLSVIILLIIMAVWLIKKPKVKRIVHAVNLKLPIVGVIIKKINLARFTLTLSSLLESTIPIIDATRISSEVLGNVIYK